MSCYYAWAARNIPLRSCKTTNTTVFCYSRNLLPKLFHQSHLRVWSVIVGKYKVNSVPGNDQASCVARSSASMSLYLVYSCFPHYSDVIMTTMASQITSLTVVYSTVYSDADQRKHQSSASLAFVWGIHRDRWIPHTKGQLRGKCFHLMTSSCWGSISRTCTTSMSRTSTTYQYTLYLYKVIRHVKSYV